MIEITVELIAVLVAWTVATITTWSLIVYVKKRVDKNGRYIDKRLSSFQTEVEVVKSLITSINTNLEGRLDGLQEEIPSLDVPSLKTDILQGVKELIEGIQGQQAASTSAAIKALNLDGTLEAMSADAVSMLSPEQQIAIQLANTPIPKRLQNPRTPADYIAALILPQAKLQIAQLAQSLGGGAGQGQIINKSSGMKPGL